MDSCLSLARFYNLFGKRQNSTRLFQVILWSIFLVQVLTVSVGISGPSDGDASIGVSVKLAESNQNWKSTELLEISNELESRITRPLPVAEFCNADGCDRIYSRSTLTRPSSYLSEVKFEKARYGTEVEGWRTMITRVQTLVGNNGPIDKETRPFPYSEARTIDLYTPVDYHLHSKDAITAKRRAVLDLQLEEVKHVLSWVPAKYLDRVRVAVGFPNLSGMDFDPKTRTLTITIMAESGDAEKHLKLQNESGRTLRIDTFVTSDPDTRYKYLNYKDVVVPFIYDRARIARMIGDSLGLVEKQKVKFEEQIQEAKAKEYSRKKEADISAATERSKQFLSGGVTGTN